jgi:YjbE family integral membrane protein
VSWKFLDAAHLIEIIGVNLVLSGDNAIVVGMAIRRLPAVQRKTALIVGIAGAMAVQIAATLTVAWVFQRPVVSCIGGILLMWIAIGLLQNDGGTTDAVGVHNGSVRHSIVMVATAYLVMCLDNIVAVAAMARGHLALLVFGLLLSCVLLLPGGLLIAEMMKRYPSLVMAGAGVLGWTAGLMIVQALMAFFGYAFDGELVQKLIPLLMAVVVVTSPLWWPGHNHCDLID